MRELPQSYEFHEAQHSSGALQVAISKASLTVAPNPPHGALSMSLIEFQLSTGRIQIRELTQPHDLRDAYDSILLTS